MVQVDMEVANMIVIAAGNTRTRTGISTTTTLSIIPSGTEAGTEWKISPISLAVVTAS